MKPEDIKIGVRYSNSDYLGYIWLGAGKRLPFSNTEYVEKILVLIKNPENPEKIGAIFKTVDDEYGAFQEDWDNFRETS